MKYNLILTLSSQDGYGTQIAHTIQKHMDGMSKIVNVSSIRSTKTELNEILNHQVTRDLKVFLVMPEFNGSYPAYFKEWIDNQGWPNNLKNQKVFLVGYSGSFSGNIIGVNHMKSVLDYIDADTFRHTAHFTYNKDSVRSTAINIKESEIFLNLLNQFNNE